MGVFLGTVSFELGPDITNTGTTIGPLLPLNPDTS
ncbi:hypothetical protein CCACVL1_13598 [Corchorus capsularis]|uniref:Uncharacterized protein n=2 Tax=Corchorus TaxID=93758 RepID=A0A1R3IAB6_COCAP|nr:hypothetical protein COLO4_34474 [Corchorus olitorius]OMO79542.1 hypothetical protein CCACVL1_13598 [Corchorus capsularis]